MWLWRKIMKVKWTEHKTNGKVLEMVQEKKDVNKNSKGRTKELGRARTEK